MKLKSYESYKDSGIEWLGEMPSEWEVRRIKDLTETQSGTTPQSGNPLYYENGQVFWIRTTDLNNNEVYEAEYKITQKAFNDYNLKILPLNSVLIAMYGGMGTIGKNGILKVKATLNQSVCAILPNSRKYISRFLQYYLQFFRPIWEIFADSARKDPNINQDEIKNLFILLPKLQTQQKIASFLDTQTAKIDKEISLLEKKIELYKELKQTLISETVLRGLDKNAELKDSGIEWIGKIPKHWEVKRLKDLSNNIFSGGTPSTNVDEYWNKNDYIWLQSGELQNNIIKKHKKNKYISFLGLCNSSTKPIKSDTVLIALTGATCANVGYLTFDACANQSVVAICSSKQFFSKFLFYYLLTQRNYIKVFQTGGAQAGINTEDVKNLFIGVPPLQEQKQIANYLDEKTSKIDKIIETISKKIDLLKEFRKTLINDVVTGKVKVE